jgi:UDP-N-acetylglucosamine transferase subunit ALG13
MILITVGAQMPFDRLIRAVDHWVGENAREDVFAQIGAGTFRPRHMPWTRFLSSEEFRAHMFEADVIVAHAGMGTILTAMEFGTPILVMPRRADLFETRNDHQFGTARQFQDAEAVAVAADEQVLLERLNRLDQIAAPPRINSHASFRLLAALNRFICGEPMSLAAEPLASLKHEPLPGRKAA